MKKKICGSIGKQRYSCFWLVILLATLSLCAFSFKVVTAASVYDSWSAIGKVAAERALGMIKRAGATPAKGNLVVITNAGYAEVKGSSTQAALDGLSDAAGASRGRNTLVEVHSSPWSPLWFAVYDKASGNCAYLEVNPDVAELSKDASNLFKVSAIEKIDAERLYKNADDYKAIFKEKIFGGNEFRIITIANAVSKGAPNAVVRAFEFHDHYCPGVTSGVMMANYLKKNFPAGDSGYFVHSVDPWCKEDALITLLNATPGKKGYAVSYPSDEDKKDLTEDGKKASTIVYRQNNETGIWEGMVLAFDWSAETGCEQTGNMAVDKLCADMWYLDRLDRPEDFVKVLKTFEMPKDVSPRDWARPGVDPLEKLGMKK